ncbi:MAG TPA: sugar ABC transporter substrate-binding protein [Actinopolymorphaceae bacterium]
MSGPRASDSRALRRGMSRRDFLVRAGVLGLGGASAAGALASCTGGRRRPQTAEGRAAEQGGNRIGTIYTDEAAEELNASLTWPESINEPSSPVTITVSHAWDASFWPRQQQFDRFFQERHPNIRVRSENTPFDDYLQKYLTQAAGGTPPDVMYNQYAWSQNLIQQGLFIPLDEYIDRQQDFDLEDFTEPSMGYYVRDGERYGIAYDCGPIMLFYNKDLFDKAGVEYPTSSWTMDDLREAVIATTSGSGRDKVFGLSTIPYPGGNFGPTRLAPFGGRFLNEDETECLLDEPESVAAAEWWLELYLEHGAMPSPTDEQAMTQTDAFTLGRAAMAANGSWASPALLEQADFEWAIADWPEGPEGRITSAEGSAYSITAKSPNKDAAWIYLNEYLSTAGQIFMWASTGRGSPARNSAWQAYLNSEFAAEGTELVQKALNTYATNDGVLFQPTTPEVVNTATPIWDRVVNRDISVADGCRQVTAALEPILAENA